VVDNSFIVITEYSGFRGLDNCFVTFPSDISAQLVGQR